MTRKTYVATLPDGSLKTRSTEHVYTHAVAKRHGGLVVPEHTVPYLGRPYRVPQASIKAQDWYIGSFHRTRELAEAEARTWTVKMKKSWPGIVLEVLVVEATEVARDRDMRNELCYCREDYEDCPHVTIWRSRSEAR